MLENLFTDLVEITMAVSLLILLLLALTPLLRRQYTAKWRYWAWLALALRLLIPLNLSLPQAPVQVNISNKTVFSAPATQPQHPTVPQAPIHTGTPAPQPADWAKGSSITIMEVLAAVWLAGTILFLLWQTLSYLHFLRQVHRWKRPVKDEQVLQLAQKVRREEGIRREIPVFVCSRISSPMVIGLFRPTLFLPQEDYGQRALYFIVKHEMGHIRRRDIWYKLVLMLANALHWFNPLVWLMSRQAGRDVEFVCDDEVIRGLDLEGKGFYGDTILEIVRKGEKAPVFSTYFSGGVRSIRDRLRNLFDQKNKRKGALALGLMVLLVGAAGLFAACSPSDRGEETVLQEARRLLEEAPAVLNWYNGSGAKADFDNAPLEGNTPGELYNWYYPVTEFTSIAQMREATEQVFSQAFCRENIYPSAFEREEHPWYREFDGALYLSERYLSAVAFTGDPLDWSSLTLVQSDGNSARVQIEITDAAGEKSTAQVDLSKEDGRWVLGSYWKMWAQPQTDSQWQEAVDPAEKEGILAALQGMIRSYQEGTVENNPLEPRFNDAPADIVWPQLATTDDFTVEKGNEMFGYKVILPAGGYNMVCFLDYFTAPVTGGEDQWLVTAVAFEPRIEDDAEVAKFLSEYLPFSGEAGSSVTIERAAQAEVLTASFTGNQAQRFCEALLGIYVSDTENPDPITGSARFYQIVLADGTTHTIEEAGDIKLDGRLICRADRSVYSDSGPAPWQYSDLTWSRYRVDLATGERTLVEEEVLPDFYAKAYLDFDMEGITGTRYAQEGDWEQVARVLESYTAENLQSLILTGGPTDQTERVPMDREQVARALETVQALKGNPWPYDPNENVNPPTGGYSAVQLVRNDGRTVQIFFNGAALTVSISGEGQSMVFDCESGEESQSAYALDSLFWEITNPGIA